LLHNTAVSESWESMKEEESRRRRGKRVAVIFFLLFGQGKWRPRGILGGRARREEREEKKRGERRFGFPLISRKEKKHMSEVFRG